MRDHTLRRTTDVTKVFPARQYEDASFFNWTEIRSLNAGQWFLEVLKSTSSKATSSPSALKEILPSNSKTVCLIFLLEFKGLRSKICRRFKNFLEHFIKHNLMPISNCYNKLHIMWKDKQICSTSVSTSLLFLSSACRVTPTGQQHH